MTTTDRPQPTGTQDDEPRRPGRGRRAATVVVVATLALGGLLGVRHWDTRMTTMVADALASLDVAAAELAEAVASGEAALADSEGQVTDDGLRAALGEALAAAALDLQVPPGSRAEQTAHATGTAARALARAAQVRDAAEEVLADVQVWRLARAVVTHAAAVGELSAAVEAGEELLAGTEGQVVPDNAPREALRGALDVAIAVRDREVDVEDVDAVTAAASAAQDAAAGVAEASADVSVAHEAWQTAEAERVAAEQAAAATAAGSKISGKSTSTSSGSRPSSGTSSGSTGGSTNTGAGGGGYWVDVGDVPGPDLCGWVDQDNNTGSC